MLQSVWLYISELAGKDLDAVIIGKLLFYLMPSLIPLVLPLTILVASIMTFGSFAENYEFAAMKASGISLQRAMRSLILFISILSVVTFFFANNVIPWSKYKAINLRYNIKKMKPALAIVEGMFNQVGPYNIKVAKKTGENGQDLHNVIIHQKMTRGNGMTVIKAKSGKLKGSGDANVLSLILYDGTTYQRIYSNNYIKRRRRPFVKNGFKSYRVNIDLSGMNDVDLDDDHYDNSASMLSISELHVALDSLSHKFNQDRENFADALMSRNGINKLFRKERKSTEKEAEEPAMLYNKDKGKPELPTYDIKNLTDFFHSYNLRSRTQTVNLALTTAQGTLRTIKGKEMNFSKKIQRLNVTEMQIQQKYALAIMCYVLFFVGAPLGAIIRKGGIGMPLVVAIILFLVYHYIGMFAENSAEDGSISPFLASWLSTFIMLPLSVMVTYKATTDQGFFNPDIIIVPVRKFFAKIGITKRKPENNA